MRGRLTACALAVAGLWLVAPVQDAFAHGESTPTIVTVIDRVTQRPPGLDMRIIRDKAARLQVTNRTGRDYEALSGSGDPFLRIGPRGVFANVNSITWYLSGNPDGQAEPPKSARIGGPARWVRISRRSSWTWFDHRMHPGTVRVGQESINGQRRARLDDWVVPGRLGGRRLDVAGHVEYRPLRGNVVTSFIGPAAPAPGVQVQLLPGRLPGMFLANSGPRPVTVIGRDGRPFARIGPKGVEVNVHSRTHVEDQVAKGLRRTLNVSDGPPVWKRISGDTHYAWLDVRARYSRAAPPEAVTAGTGKRLLGRWQIPLKAGGREIALKGKTTWVPLPQVAATAPKNVDRSTAMELGLGALGLCAAIGGAVVLRRRAAREERSTQLVG